MGRKLDTRLSVENIRLRAKHGWYDEERVLGGWYRIDVYFDAQHAEDQAYEDLSATVNYEYIQERVREVMAQEHKLIEHSCKAVFDALKDLNPSGVWTVELTKEHPPVNHLGQSKFRITG